MGEKLDEYEYYEYFFMLYENGIKIDATEISIRTLNRMKKISSKKGLNIDTYMNRNKDVMIKQ